MARVSLDIFKKHVRADDFSEDDGLLQAYLDSATQAVYDALGYTEDELSSIPDEEFPKPVCHAILMYGATLYAYRENVDSANLGILPLSFQALIKPYAKLDGGGLMEQLISKYSD